MKEKYGLEKVKPAPSLVQKANNILKEITSYVTESEIEVRHIRLLNKAKISKK